jgi:Zn-dependent protease
MADIRKGTLQIFRFRGINVYLHWSWFLVAAFEIANRAHVYSAVYWNVAEYLALFLIVTMHEFGHALACRQTGGTAEQIVLWPLGGVAYVNPPQRPGAMLWSIAAGPLVNVGLLPILSVLVAVSHSAGWASSMHDVYTLLLALWKINAILLIFNMLPVYPLDGGQILRALLWYPLGRARSMTVSVVIGFVGAAGLLIYAIRQQNIWMGLIAAYVLINCQNAWRYAQALSHLDKLPRRVGFACPECKVAPPVGNFWVCNHCKRTFDTFASGAICPNCATAFSVTKCVECGQVRPLNQWVVPVAPLAI